MILEPLNPVLEYISRDNEILVCDEIRFIKQEKQTRDRKSLENIEKEMNKLKIALAIPFGSKEKLLAVAVLPPKSNKDAYNIEDINFLNKVKTTLSFYLENYFLYLNAMDRARKGK